MYAIRSYYELVNSINERGLIKSEGSEDYTTDITKDLEVPDLLKSIIMTKIDQLAPSEKLTLQTASVIGRSYNFV